jgi:hypothetical protein
VTFNPTDTNFIEKIFNTFDKLDNVYESYLEQLQKAEENGAAFAVTNTMDKEMRGMIDELFGKPISDELFGSMNLYAAAGGLPVWCNMFLAIIDEIDTAFAREKKATNPRIQKYTQKYTKH